MRQGRVNASVPQTLRAWQQGLDKRWKELASSWRPAAEEAV